MPASPPPASAISRRTLLTSTALALLLSSGTARSLTVVGRLPWEPNAGAPPTRVEPGPWTYFHRRRGRDRRGAGSTG
ncbi:MAG: hypothetical protein WDO24_09835 [Pseudomonadota bacterium]